MEPGLLIAIEGIEGSGKHTQHQLLAERLRSAGHDVVSFDFPQLNQASSYFIKQYLNGYYGTVDHVGPYTSSLFYALDRYATAPAIRQALSQGKTVIVNRFSGSTMASHGTSFTHDEERRGFFIWLDNLEYVMLGLPRPDKNFVLHVPAKIADTLVDRREGNLYPNGRHASRSEKSARQQQTSQIYADLCQLFPKDFQRIDCVRSGKLLDPELINDMLWESVRPLLPELTDELVPATAQTAVSSDLAIPPIPELITKVDGKYDYFVPAGLVGPAKDKYLTTMDNIIDRHSLITEGLVNRFANGSATAEQQAEIYSALRSVLPVASQSTLNQHILSSVESEVEDFLPSGHSFDTEPVKLVSYWPRNEVDLVADIIYDQSDSSLTEILSAVGKLPYVKRASFLKANINEMNVEKVHYSLDLMTDYATFSDFKDINGLEDLVWQAPTPRFGYSIPDLVDEAGLSDQYEQCFDLSAELYSHLQANNYSQEARLVTLLGHRLRWKVTINARIMIKIVKSLANPQTPDNNRKLILNIVDKLAEVHPLIVEVLTTKPE